MLILYRTAYDKKGTSFFLLYLLYTKTNLFIFYERMYDMIGKTQICTLENIIQLLLSSLPSKLVVVASRPSMGKTTLALNIADYAISKANKTVAFFSLEMSKEQLVDRMITLGLNSHPQLIINDSPWLSPSKLYSVCKHFKSISKLDIIIIDYFQLMQVNTEPTISRSQKLALMIDSLKKIANKLQLTIILLSGLRRETKRRIEHKPILYDLERSGCPVADLDIAIFLYRDDYYKKNSKCPDTTELIVAKNNFGDTVTIFLKRSSNSIFHS